MKNLAKLLVAVLVTMFVLVNCGGGPSGPKDVVKESFTLMENNDVAGLKDLLSAQVKGMLDDKKLEEAVANKSQEIKDKGGIASIEFTSEDIQENEADFKVKITYGDGTTKTEKAKVVKEDGDWKLGVSK